MLKGGASWGYDASVSDAPSLIPLGSSRGWSAGLLLFTFVVIGPEDKDGGRSQLHHRTCSVKREVHAAPLSLSSINLDRPALSQRRLRPLKPGLLWSRGGLGLHQLCLHPRSADPPLSIR